LVKGKPIHPRRSKDERAVQYYRDQT